MTVKTKQKKTDCVFINFFSQIIQPRYQIIILYIIPFIYFFLNYFSSCIQVSTWGKHIELFKKAMVENLIFDTRSSK